MDHVGRVDVRHESIVFKRMCVNVGKADAIVLKQRLKKRKFD